MIREVDSSFASLGLGLRARLFGYQLWAYFVLITTLVIFIINAFIINLGGGLFAQLAFVVATGSLVFNYMTGIYSRMVLGTIEQHHYKNLKGKFDTVDHPLLLSLVRMRLQVKTKLEPIYRIDRTIFARKALINRLAESRGFSFP
jgi:hypothetical protein